MAYMPHNGIYKCCDVWQRAIWKLLLLHFVYLESKLAWEVAGMSYHMHANISLSIHFMWEGSVCILVANQTNKENPHCVFICYRISNFPVHFGFRNFIRNSSCVLFKNSMDFKHHTDTFHKITTVGMIVYTLILLDSYLSKMELWRSSTLKNADKVHGFPPCAITPFSYIFGLSLVKYNLP